MASEVPVTFVETDDCAICFSPLVIQVEADTLDELSPSAIPDDVELHCCKGLGTSGHHFHWACLQELDEEGLLDRSKCPFPKCGRNPLSEERKLLVTVRNEGGVTEDFDLGQAFDKDKEEPLSRKQEL